MPIGALLGRGRTAEIFEWDNERVIKLYYAGVSSELIEREAKSTLAAYEFGAPAPAVYETLKIGDRYGTVLERIDGPTLQADIAARPWRLVQSARLLATLHTRLHALRAPTLPVQRAALAHKIRHAPALDEARRQFALDALARNNDGHSMCHGDLHPANVILSARGPIILDWAEANCGNPLADVARSAFLIAQAVVPGDARIPRMVLALRKFWCRLYTHYYCRLQSHTHAEIMAWMTPIVAARLHDGVTEEQPSLLRQLETSRQ